MAGGKRDRTGPGAEPDLLSGNLPERPATPLSGPAVATATAAGVLGLSAAVLSVLTLVSDGAHLHAALVALFYVPSAIVGIASVLLQRRFVADRMAELRAETARHNDARQRLVDEIERRGAEIAELTRRQQLLLAEDDLLRERMQDSFVNLSMRSLTLVERQLDLIEKLERSEEDSRRLDDLFRLDHLATRMRRNSENVLVLANADERHGHRPAGTLLDVVRAAVSEIEYYERVDIGHIPRAELAGHSADDVSHLLAELLENAAAYSPPGTRVTVAGRTLENRGILLTVEDEGFGVPPDRLPELNAQLQGGRPATGTADLGGLGVFVVGALAVRHGLRVQLRPRRQGGLAAIVLIPAALLHGTGPSPSDITHERELDRGQAAVRGTSGRPSLQARHEGAGRDAARAAGRSAGRHAGSYAADEAAAYGTTGHEGGGDEAAPTDPRALGAEAAATAVAEGLVQDGTQALWATPDADRTVPFADPLAAGGEAPAPAQGFIGPPTEAPTNVTAPPPLPVHEAGVHAADAPGALPPLPRRRVARDETAAPTIGTAGADEAAHATAPAADADTTHLIYAPAHEPVGSPEPMAASEQLLAPGEPTVEVGASAYLADPPAGAPEQPFAPGEPTIDPSAHPVGPPPVAVDYEAGALLRVAERLRADMPDVVSHGIEMAAGTSTGQALPQRRRGKSPEAPGTTAGPAANSPGASVGSATPGPPAVEPAVDPAAAPEQELPRRRRRKAPQDAAAAVPGTTPDLGTPAAQPDLPRRRGESRKAEADAAAEATATFSGLGETVESPSSASLVDSAPAAPARGTVTDRGLPKRVPRTRPGAAPAATTPSGPDSGPVDAAELRRRLSEFQRGSVAARQAALADDALLTPDFSAPVQTPTGFGSPGPGSPGEAVGGHLPTDYAATDLAPTNPAAHGVPPTHRIPADDVGPHAPTDPPPPGGEVS